MASFSVNGQDFNFSGENFRNIRITDQGVFVNGVKVDCEDFSGSSGVTVVINAPVYDLSLENVSAEFHKEVGKIRSDQYVKCGNVAGDVQAGQYVKCANVRGSVSAGQYVKAQAIYNQQ